MTTWMNHPARRIASAMRRILTGSNRRAGYEDRQENSFFNPQKYGLPSPAYAVHAGASNIAWCSQYRRAPSNPDKFSNPRQPTDAMCRTSPEICAGKNHLNSMLPALQQPCSSQGNRVSAYIQTSGTREYRSYLISPSTPSTGVLACQGLESCAPYRLLGSNCGQVYV